MARRPERGAGRAGIIPLTLRKDSYEEEPAERRLSVKQQG